jgi:hypothetical protein
VGCGEGGGDGSPPGVAREGEAVGEGNGAVAEGWGRGEGGATRVGVSFGRLLSFGPGSESVPGEPSPEVEPSEPVPLLDNSEPAVTWVGVRVGVKVGVGVK